MNAAMMNLDFMFYLDFSVQSITVKKIYFQDLLSQHFFFCQINLNNLFSSYNLLF